MIETAKDLGDALREAREGAGISLGSMARRANFSKSYLGLAETGRKKVSAAVLLAYEQVLGKDFMNRRGLVTGVAAGVIAPIAAAELIRAGFTAAMGSKRSIEDWEERVDTYGHDYMVLGADELQNHLARDLVVAQQHLEHPKMWDLTSRIMTMAGKTSRESKDSVEWYRVAGEAADRSADLSTMVWVRGRAALALAYEGARIPVAEEFARQAIQLDDKPSLGRLNALLGLAHVYAHYGRTKDAISTFNAARRVFDQVGSYEQISDTAIPEWRMAIISSLLLSRLGEESAAVRQQEIAMRTIPRNLPRFATHIELHRGLMLVKSGDRAAGLDYARTAMNALPEDKRSQSQRLMLTEIERAAGAKPANESR